MKFYLVLFLFFSVILLSVVISEARPLSVPAVVDTEQALLSTPVVVGDVAYYEMSGLDTVLVYELTKINSFTIVPRKAGVQRIRAQTKRQAKINSRTIDSDALPGLGGYVIARISKRKTSSV